MPITLLDPQAQTIIFGIVFFTILFFSLRKKTNHELFSLETTQELKGVALIFILLGHIGYALFPNTNFLFPFSVFAGVGVDIFLFLSGYGLTMSALKKDISLKEFYKKRISKIVFPLWSTLLFFFVLDFVFLSRTYSFSSMISSFLGFFPRADLWQDINSPLWYITLILFYYLLYPIFFNKKMPILSAVGLYAITWLLLQCSLPVNYSVEHLYSFHSFAFPLGIMVASRFYLLRGKQFILFQNKLLRRTLLILSGVGLFYFGIHSGFGKGDQIQEGMSLLLLVCALSLFLFKRFEIRLFTYFGLYSFEIYLLHWPLLSRYDFVYRFFPAGLATILWFALFLCFGFLFQFLKKIKTAREGLV